MSAFDAAFRTDKNPFEVTEETKRKAKTKLETHTQFNPDAIPDFNHLVDGSVEIGEALGKEDKLEDYTKEEWSDLSYDMWNEWLKSILTTDRNRQMLAAMTLIAYHIIRDRIVHSEVR